MALIPHGFFPRSTFDMDQWFKPIQQHLTPNTLDLFDPFDELDHAIGRNMHWLNKPEFMQPFPVIPRVPQKYRITLDCVGYSPKSIKTEIKDNRLIVLGREEEKEPGSDDFHVKEFKKTYVIPENCEQDKLISFMTSHGQLVLEMPIKETSMHLNADLFPKIVDTPSGGKEVTLKFTVPEKIDPSKVHVHIKDRDLIVKAEDKVEKPDSVSKFYYYKRTTMPENTKFEDLKCVYDNHQITIQAPLNTDWKAIHHKKVPIDFKPTPAIKQ